MHRREGNKHLCGRIAAHFERLPAHAVNQGVGSYYPGWSCCVGAHLANFFDKAQFEEKDFVRGGEAFASALGLNLAQVVIMLRTAGAGVNPFSTDKWPALPADVFHNLAEIEEAPDTRGANLAWASIIGAKLESADFAGAKLEHAIFNCAKMAGANLRGADCRFVGFRFTDLQRADLREANLLNADMEQTDLRGADLRGVNLHMAHLYNANLAGADLRGADLSNTDFRRSYLDGVNLEGADMAGAVLANANPAGKPRNLDEAKNTGSICWTDADIYARVEKDREEARRPADAGFY